MRLFGGGEARHSDPSKQRVPRHSSGWNTLRSFLRDQESLRVLDIGPTSSTNINLLTSWGHSIYMADLVGEAQASTWLRADAEPGEEFDTAAFLNANLPATGRLFDVVLFWDAADYLPKALVGPLFDRLHQVMATGGRLLLFGHVKPETGFHRYHLRDDDQVDVQPISALAVANIYTNRQMETLLNAFATYRFFLAKDNLREVLVNR